MTVGIAMIVRDEEAVLARCLDAVRPHVDELVIVDTGSVDATREIARRYTDRVLDLVWTDDFATARQHAFDQATTDWVCWLDADDLLHGAAHLRPLVAAAGDDVGGFAWRYVLGYDDWGNPSLTYWRERCVRNDGSYHWVGRVHEVLIAKPDAPPRRIVNADEVVVEHRPEPGAHDRPGRNLAILTGEEEAAEGGSPRRLFYLAREQADHGQVELAIATFERYLMIAVWDDERYLAQTQVAALHRRQGRFDQAIEADLRALAIHPHWPDAYFGLAESCYYRGDWSKVVLWIESGRQFPVPETPLFVDPTRYSHGWIIFYTNALYHLGQVEEALLWTRTALGYNPDDPWHRENLKLFNRLVIAPGRALVPEIVSPRPPTP